MLTRNYQVKSPEGLPEWAGPGPVFSLAWTEPDQPDLSVCLLLFGDPGTRRGIPELRHLLEKGRIAIGLQALQPAPFPENWMNQAFSCLQSIDVELADLSNEQVLLRGTCYDAGHILRLEGIIDPVSCLKVLRAMENRPSPIHVSGVYTILQDGRHIRFRFQCSLRECLGAGFFALGSHALQASVRYLYFNRNTLAYEPVPPLMKKSVVPYRDFSEFPPRVVGKGSGFITAASLVRPSVASSQDLSKISGISFKAQNGLWVLPGLSFGTGKDKPKENLPEVDDLSDMLWKDALLTGKFWFMPEAAVVPPGQGDSISASPFLLTFQRIGTAADGMPVLQGEVRLTLRFSMPEEAKAKLNANPGVDVKPINLIRRTCYLQLPVTDIHGTLRETTVHPSEVTEQSDRIVLVFRLSNEWIRACYGVFSMEGFQPVPAKLRVQSAFRGLAPLKKNKFTLIQGISFLKLPLVINRDNSSQPVFDIRSRSLVVGDTSIGYRDTKGDRAVKPLALTSLQKKPVMLKATAASFIMAKQKVKMPEKDIKGEEWAVQDFCREQVLEVLFPCSQFGEYYVEQMKDVERRVIGCHEPYRLGEITFRLFQEIPELKTSHYQVYRSLQSPDTFVVRPSTYRVTRFEPLHPELAFRPCMHMYGTIEEKNNFQSSFCILDFSMEPDIPAYAWYLLGEALKKRTNSRPGIFFPGELMDSVEFEWSIPEQIRMETHCFGRTIQATLSLDLMQVLSLENMLKNGLIAGTATYRFADNTEMSCTLRPDSMHMTGPWGIGPVNIDRTEDRLILSNQTEKKVLVRKLYRLDEQDHVLEERLVEQKIISGASLDLDAMDQGGRILADAEEEPAAGELDQSWVFMDDVDCQAIFSTSIDFEQHQISGIAVEARFRDGPDHLFQGELVKAEPAITFDSFIPLNKITGDRVVEFRVRTGRGELEGSFGNWLQWNIKEQGSIINLTSDLLFNSSPKM